MNKELIEFIAENATPSEQLAAIGSKDFEDDADFNIYVEEGFSKPKLVPTVDTKPEELAEAEVDYTKPIRGPRDVVLSGPVIGGWGPGRYIQSQAKAMEFFIEKFGAKRVSKLPRWTKGRWAVLIKDLKAE